MKDGSIWEIPAEVIAESRASYYSDADEETDFHEEFEFTINDKSELIDWACNNMDWDDVVDRAICIQPPKVSNYRKDWMNGNMEVVKR